MRERLSTVGYVSAGAMAAVALGVGLGLGFGLASPASKPVAVSDSQASHARQAGPARTAAADCGRSCFILYSRRFGEGTTMNAVVPAGNGTGGKVGRKVNMRLAAAKLPAGDFSFSFIAKVWQFCGTDQHDFFRPASYLCTRDQNFWVFEAEWSPYGNSSGLCAGVAIANKIGEDVTLRPCGANDHTLWIANQASGSGGNCRGSADYCPWMNASDSNFRSPNVLTLDSSTKSPADQLRLYQEKLLPAGNQGRAWNNQEFAFFLRAGS